MLGIWAVGGLLFKVALRLAWDLRGISQLTYQAEFRKPPGSRAALRSLATRRRYPTPGEGLRESQPSRDYGIMRKGGRIRRGGE